MTTNKIDPTKLTPEDLAYSFPGAFAWLVSGGKWQYATHLKLIEEALLRAMREPVRLLISMPPRHGKLIIDSTPVFTTRGWVKHGDLKSGDYVFGLDGKPTQVVAVSPPSIADIEVETMEGEVIKCHRNHEWVVYNRSRGEYMTLEASYFLEHKPWISNRCVYMLPPRPVLETKPRKDLTIPPYALGVWLGDGQSTASVLNLTPQDEEAICESVFDLGYKKGAVNYHPTTGVPAITVLGLVAQLRGEGLYNNKHIPEKYLLGSLDQRLELLAGLIDTDGYVHPETGRVTFVTTNESLRDGVTTLAHSIGSRVSTEVVQPCTSTSGIVGKQVVYYVKFNPNVPIPTRVPRKYAGKIDHQKRRIGIRDVRVSKQSETGRCIQVASPDGIYLVGKSMVPTHNSQLCSEMFPAWWLGRNPDAKVMLVTYQADYSKMYGRRARNALKMWGQDIFGVKVAEDTAAANHWEIEGHQGLMETVGMGGAITGKGASLMIIDDPVKGRETAMSAKALDDMWDFWGSDLYTRLEKNGSVIIIQTRWSSDDLTGKLIKKMKDPDGEHWDVISLPAFAEEGVPDILNRKPGDPLWPDQFDKTALNRIKSNMSTYWWQALYQQTPTPIEGEIIKLNWFRRYNEYMGSRSSFDQVVLSIDTAQKDTDMNDYSVIGVFGIKENAAYLIDVIRDRLTHPKLLELLESVIARWIPNSILIEDKGSGISLIQHLAEITNAPVIPVNPGNESKVMRMINETPMLEAGRVFIPESESVAWVGPFEDEVRGFPRFAYRDQVDMLSQFLKYYRESALNPIEIF